MAVLIWLMIVPMLVKIDFAALGSVREHWRGIGVTLFINWAVKPFSMAALGWLFIGYLFRPYLPADQINSYIAGLIILAAAPCTAMVFVWSNLTKGEPHFTLSQVALNDTIMVFAFAPIVGLLLGLSAITVPWGTLVLSVVLYIVVPVIVAQIVRRNVLARGGQAALASLLSKLQPLSLVALLATLVLLFGFQGEQILAQPLIIGLLAVPILIQVYFNAGFAYLLNRLAGEQHCVAGPSALIGASNFFELAVAAAISLFGFNSGAALATVVGVLIEVPVMLSVVAIVNRSRGWYERGIKSSAAASDAALEPPASRIALSRLPMFKVAALFAPETCMARDQIDMTPIETRDELVAWLEAGCKPKAQFRVGTEHEKFAFTMQGHRPVPYAGPHSHPRVARRHARPARLGADHGGRQHHRHVRRHPWRRHFAGAGRAVRTFRRAGGKRAPDRLRADERIWRRCARWRSP